MNAEDAKVFAKGAEGAVAVFALNFVALRSVFAEGVPFRVNFGTVSLGYFAQLRLGLPGWMNFVANGNWPVEFVHPTLR
jgi:hypothetical protein